MDKIQVDFDRKVFEATNPGAEDAELDALVSEGGPGANEPPIGDPTAPPAAAPAETGPNWTLDEERTKES